MPFATALLKLLLFAMWAHPTYKMTVDMYEKRERRQGILPDDDKAGDRTKDRITDGTVGSAPKEREPAAGADGAPRAKKTG